MKAAPGGEVKRWDIEVLSSISRNIRERFFSPPKPIWKWLDSGALLLCGLTCLLAWYLIVFNICASGDCSRLTIMKYWVSYARLFILYGLAQIGVCAFLAQARDLARIYRFAIVVSGLVGTMLIGMVVFGIAVELNAIA